MENKKQDKIESINEKDRYMFFSGGLHGDPYVLDRKTGKRQSVKNFLLS